MIYLQALFYLPDRMPLSGLLLA